MHLTNVIVILVTLNYQESVDNVLHHVQLAKQLKYIAQLVQIVIWS